MKYSVPLLSSTRSIGRGFVARPLACVAVAVSLLAGCDSFNRTVDTPPAAEPGATYTGEAYLRGTVSSYGQLINHQPLLVSGYGLVVDLNGTGSNEVPAFLREWLMTEMRRNNVGSVQYGTGDLSPQRALSDAGSSVVAIEGFIPPGAVAGAKFDLLVTMIDQNSTSLAGGRIFWPTNLTENGLNSQLNYTRTQALAYGAMYINPVNGSEGNVEFLRQAIVVNGGTVAEPRQIQMVLNQRSYSRTRQIADRVNERFPAGQEDRIETAVAKSDQLIEFNIPERFSNDPEGLLALIGHLHLDPSPNFATYQAKFLSDRLLEQPETRALSVAAAWKTLGRNITPTLRELYAHDNLTVRLTALEAGAWLQDRQAVDPLIALTQGDDPAQRIRAARLLMSVNGVSRARDAVRLMLHDPDPAIRIGGYEALSMVGDPAIERMVVGRGEQFKFNIDRVHSDEPMIFATQEGDPSIVIFGPELGFRGDIFSQVGTSLMLRSIPVDSIRNATNGLHEGETAFVPVHWRGRRELVEPDIRTSLGANPDEPIFQTELGDVDGATGQVIKVRVRGQAAMDAMNDQLLSALPFSRATASDRPAAIAVVRLVSVPYRNDDGQMEGEYIAELLALQDPQTPLPVDVRYTAPGSRRAQSYRIAPTVATLAYTLGYERSDHLAKLGPDLPYSTVVQTIYQLCEEGMIDAPFEVHFNEIAELVEEAQRAGVVDERPEFDFVEETDPSQGPATPGEDNGELTPLAPIDEPAQDPAVEPRPE